MMNNSKVLLPMIAIISLLLLVSCSNSSGPGGITAEQGNELAQTYFQKLYHKSVIVKKVYYLQVGEHKYRNSITVSEGETEYNLYLDANNKPLFDDVSAEETIKNIDISSFKKEIESLGLKQDEYRHMFSGVSYDDKRCSVLFAVVSVDRPKKETGEGIYSLLGTLKNEGISEFSITISTPEFLCPKMETDYGVHGIVLASESFETSINKTSFDKQYNSFVESIYWNKQKFDDKILKLTQSGYRNVFFFVKPEPNPNTDEIMLYYESDSSLSDEQANALLSEMDESFFKIGTRKTIYTLLRK